MSEARVGPLKQTLSTVILEEIIHLVVKKNGYWEYSDHIFCPYFKCCV